MPDLHSAKHIQLCNSKTTFSVAKILLFSPPHFIRFLMIHLFPRCLCWQWTCHLIQHVGSLLPNHSTCACWLVLFHVVSSILFPQICFLPDFCVFPASFAAVRNSAALWFVLCFGDYCVTHLWAIKIHIWRNLASVKLLGYEHPLNSASITT